MVSDAIEKAEEVLKDVNEAARRHENKQKLQELTRLVDTEGLEVRNILDITEALVALPTSV
jgi:hypothetical protein